MMSFQSHNSVRFERLSSEVETVVEKAVLDAHLDKLDACSNRTVDWEVKA